MAMATGDHEAAMATGATKDAQMELEEQLLGSEGSASPKSDGGSSHTSSTADALTDMTIGGKSMRVRLQEDVEYALAGDDVESNDDDVERPAAHVAARARATVETALGMRGEVEEDDEERSDYDDDDDENDSADDWASDIADELKGAKMLRGKKMQVFISRLTNEYRRKKEKSEKSGKHKVVFPIERVITLAANCTNKKQKPKSEQVSETQDLVNELVSICQSEVRRGAAGNYEEMKFAMVGKPMRDLTAIIHNEALLADIITAAATSVKGASLIVTFNKVLLGRIVLLKRMMVANATGWAAYVEWLKTNKMSAAFANNCALIAGLTLCVPNAVLHSRLSRIVNSPKQVLAKLLRITDKEKLDALQAPFHGAEVKLDESKMQFAGFKGQPLHMLKEYFGYVSALHHSEPTESQMRKAHPLWNVALPKMGDADAVGDAVREAKRLKKAAPQFVREFPAGRKLTEGQVAAMKSVMQVEVDVTHGGHFAPCVVPKEESEVRVRLVQHLVAGKVKKWSVKTFSMAVEENCGIVVPAYQNAMLKVMPVDGVDLEIMALEYDHGNRGKKIIAQRNIQPGEKIGQFAKHGVANFEIHVVDPMQAMAEPVELTGLPPPNAIAVKLALDRGLSPDSLSITDIKRLQVELTLGKGITVAQNPEGRVKRMRHLLEKFKSRHQVEVL